MHVIKNCAQSSVMIFRTKETLIFAFSREYYRIKSTKELVPFVSSKNKVQSFLARHPVPKLDVYSFIDGKFTFQLANCAFQLLK